MCFVVRWRHRQGVPSSLLNFATQQMAMNTLIDFEGLLVNNDTIGIDTFQVKIWKKL
jgi:hypothetical protein